MAAGKALKDLHLQRMQFLSSSPASLTAVASTCSGKGLGSTVRGDVGTPWPAGWHPNLTGVLQANSHHSHANGTSSPRSWKAWNSLSLPSPWLPIPGSPKSAWLGHGSSQMPCQPIKGALPCATRVILGIEAKWRGIKDRRGTGGGTGGGWGGGSIDLQGDGLSSGGAHPPWLGGSGLWEAVLARLLPAMGGGESFPALRRLWKTSSGTVLGGTPCWCMVGAGPAEGPALILEPREVRGARTWAWLPRVRPRPGAPVAGSCAAAASRSTGQLASFPGLACCHIQAFLKTTGLFLTAKHRAR